MDTVGRRSGHENNRNAFPEQTKFGDIALKSLLCRVSYAHRTCISRHAGKAMHVNAYTCEPRVNQSIPMSIYSLASALWTLSGFYLNREPSSNALSFSLFLSFSSCFGRDYDQCLGSQTKRAKEPKPRWTVQTNANIRYPRYPPPPAARLISTFTFTYMYNAV